MKPLIWKGCYNESAKKYINPASFSHPAKMSIALCRRIFRFMQEKGLIHKGQIILDPFGGGGITRIVGAYESYQVILHELEPKFISLIHENIKKHSPIF